MILSETLWKHLAEIDEECNEMMDRLVGQMAKKEGVTEQLKSDDWLGWLQKMNSIRSRAEEVVLHLLLWSGQGKQSSPIALKMPMAVF